MLSNLDISVVIFYAISLFALAQWVSREQAGHNKDTSDYFLAGKSLPWWAIGASLIAANISALANTKTPATAKKVIISESSECATRRA